MVEIHCEDGSVVVCKDLETACNRLDDLVRKDRRHPRGFGLARWRRWLVDTRAEHTVEVQRPGKHLRDVVCVRGAHYEAEILRRQRKLGLDVRAAWLEQYVGSLLRSV